MKLSEAIRLGAMLKPQGFGSYGDDKTCALGAARDAGYDIYADSVHAINESACPVCERRVYIVVSRSGEFGQENTIPHLNDTHHWSREQIADWVQTVEEAQADDSERHQALTVSTDLGRGTTALEQPVLSTRAC